MDMRKLLLQTAHWIFMKRLFGNEASASDLGRSYSGLVRITYNGVTVVQINFALPYMGL